MELSEDIRPKYKMVRENQHNSQNDISDDDHETTTKITKEEVGNINTNNFRDIKEAIVEHTKEEIRSILIDILINDKSELNRYSEKHSCPVKTSEIDIGKKYVSSNSRKESRRPIATRKRTNLSCTSKQLKKSEDAPKMHFVSSATAEIYQRKRSSSPPKKSSLVISKQSKNEEDSSSSDFRTFQVLSENNDPDILTKKDGQRLISMASFNWLEKSNDIITRATGRPSTSFDTTFQAEYTLSNDELHVTPSRYVTQNPNFVTNRTQVASLTKCLKNKGTSRPHICRPTTALERRKLVPKPSKPIRSRMEQLEKILLATINRSMPQSSSSRFPPQLENCEWENELARNIITLYSSKMDVDGATIFDECSNNLETKRGNFSSMSERQIQKVSKASSADSNRSMASKLNPEMIWFFGSGSMRMDWNILGDQSGKFSKALEMLVILEESHEHLQYVELLEATLYSYCTPDIEKSVKEELWRNLIVACNSFGTLLIEQKKFARALELLEKAENLLRCNKVLQPCTVKELRAYIKDSYAFYYAKRKKPSAALQYIVLALKIHKSQSNLLSFVKSLLHQSIILYQLNKYGKSLECLKRALGDFRSGLLDGSSDNSNLLLLVSIIYHNMAVIQIEIGHICDACVNSQNARRLAKTCLNISSKFIPTYEVTHKRSLIELSSILQKRQNNSQTHLFQKAIQELFN